MRDNNKAIFTRRIKSILKSCGLLEPLKDARSRFVKALGYPVLPAPEIILSMDEADLYGKLTDRNLDTGPCRISQQRLDHINAIKYKRDLSKTEAMDYLAYLFYHFFGYNLDFENPVTYNEKLHWLKVFHHNPLTHIIADKARLPGYLEKTIPYKKEHIIKSLAIFHAPEEMTDKVLETLPDRFILKSNYGSGDQEFVNKQTADIAHLRERIAYWLTLPVNNYYIALGYCYKDIPPAVVCEPIIDFDYKIEFFCFDGVPVFYWIVINDKTSDTRANLYEMDGTKMPVQWHYPNFDEEIPQPGYFNELVEIAKKLSSPFPHVRVDFYGARKTWYFSELTFYTWAGLSPFSEYSFDVELGKKIRLEPREEG